MSKTEAGDVTVDDTHPFDVQENRLWHHLAYRIERLVDRGDVAVAKTLHDAMLGTIDGFERAGFSTGDARWAIAVALPPDPLRPNDFDHRR